MFQNDIREMSCTHFIVDQFHFKPFYVCFLLLTSLLKAHIYAGCCQFD